MTSSHSQAENGEYVIWVHVQDSSNASYSNVAVLHASASSIAGPYTWSSNFFANGLVSKDSTLFTDVDGSSYFVRDTAHICDSVSPLTADGRGVKPICTHTGPPTAKGIYGPGCKGKYHGPGNGTASHPAWVCEGVAMFRDPVDGTLFMLGSHLSSWSANGAMLFSAGAEVDVCPKSGNMTPWTYLGNPAVGPNSTSTFASQSTFVLPWNKTVAVVGLDMWMSPNETEATLVWLPFKRNSTTGRWTMRWESEWTVAPHSFDQAAVHAKGGGAGGGGGGEEQQQQQQQQQQEVKGGARAAAAAAGTVAGLGASAAVLVTKPVVFDTGQSAEPVLFINARGADKLTIQVEDSSTAGALPGLSATDFIPILASNADNERLAVGWSGGAKALRAAAGKSIRIRFIFASPVVELFSFWISKNSCGASGGFVAAGGKGFNSSRDLYGAC